MISIEDWAEIRRLLRAEGGIDHVGLSSDFSYDYADFLDELTRSPHLFDESYTRWGPIQLLTTVEIKSKSDGEKL